MKKCLNKKDFFLLLKIDNKIKITFITIYNKKRLIKQVLIIQKKVEYNFH